MRSFTRLASAVMAAALLFAAPARAADLIVATDTAFVPFEFKQGDKYVGFDIDLWDAVAKDIGVTYKLQPMDFNGIIRPCRPSRSMSGSPASRSRTSARRRSTFRTAITTAASC